MHTYQGGYRQAEEYFERALARQPNLRFALHNYGFALWSQAKFEAALEPLRKAARIDPLSGVTLFLVADSLVGTSDFDAAVAQYRQCQAALPEYPSCALGLSTLQRLMGNYASAREGLAHASTLTGNDNFWLQLSSGLLDIAQGRFEAAGTSLERAQEQFPRDYALLRGQLQLSLATDTLGAFLERWERLATESNGNRDLALIGGLAWFHAGDCLRALASYGPHLDAIEPYLVNIWDAEAGFSHAVALAWCHGQLGNPEGREEALAALGAYVDQLPAAPIFAQRYLAAAYARLSGRQDRAQDALNRLREDGWPLTWISERQPVFAPGSSPAPLEGP
jgi:tetratricopeptide (TPR) repeat protein